MSIVSFIEVYQSNVFLLEEPESHSILNVIRLWGYLCFAVANQTEFASSKDNRKGWAK
jgi:hypothetical protein